MFAIDVELHNFQDCFASGCSIRIVYTNPAITINEVATETSAMSVLNLIGAEFEFESGIIELDGIQPPLDEGEVITLDNEAVIFTIFYSAPAGECSDFYFTVTDLYVAFPSIPDWEEIAGSIICDLNDVCINDVTISGLIESPILDCDDSANGGIEGIPVYMNESYMIEAFNCTPHSDIDGEYACPVVRGLDYRVQPKNNHNRGCGLSSLDIDDISDYLLCNFNPFTDPWQLIAGDVDQNGSLSSLDAVEIQKVISNWTVYWPSWTFVPTSTYTGFYPPNCLSNPNFVPDYDPFIDFDEISASVSNADFVGIKMGDVDGTCTDCSDDFSAGPSVEVRNSAVNASIKMNSSGNYVFCFDQDQNGVEVLTISFLATETPLIVNTILEQHENFVTNYRDGVFYVSYASHIVDGDTFKAGEAIIELKVLHGGIVSSSEIINEMVISDELYPLSFDWKFNDSTVLYPNPSTGDITLQVPESETGNYIKFFSIDGVLVDEVFIENKTTSLKLLLPPGIYLYTLSGTSFNTGKLVIH